LRILSLGSELRYAVSNLILALYSFSRVGTAFFSGEGKTNRNFCVMDSLYSYRWDISYNILILSIRQL
jgi:hypothetical protein